MPMWSYGYGMGGMLWGALAMLLCLALFGLLIWGLLSLIERRMRPDPLSEAPSGALETLQRRYARGEIDEQTYQRMRERLTTRGPQTSPEPAR